MRKIAVDTDEIVRLYVEEGLSGCAIARQLEVTDALIYRVLEEAGVERSCRARLPMDEVIRLYVQEGWPAYKIAAKFGTTGPTVGRHLREAGVVTRSSVEARQPGGRRPCPKSLSYRSYVLGLVWGDFWVHRFERSGLTVTVSSNTTHQEQVQLIGEVFGPFGPIYRQGPKGYRASLDLSFSFLEAKYQGGVPGWVRGAEATAAFVAGYVDAEGSFGVYEGRARFKLDSYDAEVLEWIHRWCRRNGVRSRHRRVAQKGDLRSDGTQFNQDLWRVNVNDGLSLLRFIATLDPYLRHQRRIAGAQRARDNVVQRLRSRIEDRLEPLPLSHLAC